MSRYMRWGLALSNSSLALLAAGWGTAVAQEIEAEQPAEVVVTGTRIGRPEYESPTHIVVRSADELRAVAPGNLADGLNQLPQFSTSFATGFGRSNNPGTSTSFGSGANYAELRSLGANRTLILLDGRRVGPTDISGVVDINTLPQDLVQRVEVVTGGVSAAYGSDAVAGVVNFILDTKFQGLRGTIQGGVSGVGDGESWRVGVTGGTSFAEGRGHVVANVDLSNTDSIDSYSTKRDWYRRGAGLISNVPADALPNRLTIPANVTSAISTFGGLITTSPLRGIQFGPGGEPMPFEFGELVSGNFMVGGDGVIPLTNLTAQVNRKAFFTHITYDVTDDITFFVEGNYARVRSPFDQYPAFHNGAFAFEIFPDNAFLPESIRQQMIDQGIESFRLGRMSTERHMWADARSDNYRVTLGFKGALTDRWSFEAYYAYSDTTLWQAQKNDPIHRNLYAAVDAVVNPDTGEIVCRSTLVNGTDPGCVPFNPFGVGSPSDAAWDYVLGEAVREKTMKQDFVSASIQGEIFSLWSDPAALAVGVEYRREDTNQTVDPLSESRADVSGIRGAPAFIQGQRGAYLGGNPQPLGGSFDIKEAFAEIILPVVKDVSLANELEIGAAVRYADYSTSGGVTTWKGSLNYKPWEDLRLRVSRSRDIRGPNIGELFTGSIQGISTVRDPATGETLTFVSNSGGNPNLAPEEADTWTLGLVYQPSWLPGLSVSADWWDTEISGAIAVLGFQQIMDECFRGNQLLCAQITNIGGTLRINNTQLNLNSLFTSGADTSISYTTNLRGGTLSLLAMAQFLNEMRSQAPGSAEVNSTKSIGKWKGTLSLTYARDPFSVTVQERVIGRRHASNACCRSFTWVEGIDVDDNTVPTVTYTDLVARWRPSLGIGESELFLTVNNLFDKEPPLSPFSVAHFQVYSDFNYYDNIGRYFTVGLKVNF